MKILSGQAPKIEKFLVGSGGVTRGDAVIISSGKVVKCTVAVSAATFVGIAQETKAADAVCLVSIYQQGDKIRAPYTGSTKTSLADTDLATLFDFAASTAAPTTIDLDDTIGGIALCKGYDNDANTIDFIIPASYLYF